MTSWKRARIIPVQGIAKASEAEQRATSATLAVLSIVRPFSKTVLSPYGASRADRALVETFVEVTFKSSTGGTVRPDGLIRVSYGKQEPWTALVEVKTGTSALDADQVNAYWDVARAEGFDAVLTISNEIAPSPGVHPTDGLKQRVNSKVKIHHLSWTRLLTAAVIEKSHRGVDDPEQDWILGELIRYLEHDASGAMGFDDMGASWSDVHRGARNGTLNARSDDVLEIAQRWDQLLGFVSLRLGADIGEDVTEVLPRAQQQDQRLRTKAFVDSLCDDGVLEGTLRVPNTIGDLDVEVDLKARQIAVSVSFDAPADKSAKARISWLLRQLRDAPDLLVVDAYPKNSRDGEAASLHVAKEDPSLLIDESGRPPHRFRVTARSEMAQSRRRRGQRPGFVESVRDAIASFYGDVLQDLTAYQEKAPKLMPMATVEADLPSVPLNESIPPPPSRSSPSTELPEPQP